MVMNFKEMREDLEAKSFLSSGSLLWGAGCRIAEEDTPVTETDMLREYSCTPSEAKECLKMVRKMKIEAKSKEEKDAAQMAKAEKRTAGMCRDEARAAENKLTDMILSYLKPRLRIHYRDKTVVLYTYFNDKLDLYKVAFMPTRAIQLSELVGYLRQAEPESWDEMRNALSEALEEMAPVFSEAGRLIPEFMSLMLRAVEQILSLEHPDVVLPKDLPILSWTEDALLRLDPSKLKPGRWPHCKAYMQRVSHPKHLMAFIWKCFDPSDTGRQIVWSQSLGHSGQSTFWNVIFSQLEKIAVSLSKSSHQDKHTLAECYLKRFAMVSDCSNKHFYSTDLVKQLSGFDQSSVRQMYKDAFAARLFCRVVALSNISPEVDTTSNAMRTRLLFFTTKPFAESEANPEVENEYRKEFWHFLEACKRYHDELCKKDEEGKYGPIPMPDDMWEAIRARCDKPIRNMVRAFVNDRVRLDPEGSILHADLSKQFKAYYCDRMKLGSESIGALNAEKDVISQAFDNLIVALLESDPLKIKDANGMKRYLGVKIIPAEAKGGDDEVEL
jgi:hypothetical protein